MKVDMIRILDRWLSRRSDVSRELRIKRSLFQIRKTYVISRENLKVLILILYSVQLSSIDSSSLVTKQRELSVSSRVVTTGGGGGVTSSREHREKKAEENHHRASYVRRIRK